MANGAYAPQRVTKTTGRSKVTEVAMKMRELIHMHS